MKALTPRFFFAFILVLVPLLVGCSSSVEVGSGPTASKAPTASPSPSTIQAAPSCLPGTGQPDDQKFLKATTGAAQFTFAAGPCFDVQQLTVNEDVGQLPARVAACSSMGLDSELNKIFGHGLRQIQSGLKPDYLESALCGFSYQPAYLASVSDWRQPNHSSLTFQFMKGPSNDSELWPYDFLLSAFAGKQTLMPNVGAEAVSVDSPTSDELYAIVATGDNGTAVRISTEFPPSLRDEQTAINALLPSWVNLALKQAEKLPEPPK